MMEPRWKQTPRHRFLGGTPDFDLHLSAAGFLIIVAGSSDDEWAAYHLNSEGRLMGLGENDENSYTDIAMRERIIAKREEIENYVRIFAPDAVEQLADH